MIQLLASHGLDPMSTYDDGSYDKPNQSFEEAADAVVNGDIEALTRLPDAKPWLVRWRSNRPHGRALTRRLRCLRAELSGRHTQWYTPLGVGIGV